MFDSDWDATKEKRDSPLPDGLATMAPGAELGAWLETVDRSALNGYELVVVAQATMRQISHLQAEFYDTVNEVALTPLSGPDDPPLRIDTIDELVVDELGAALRLTRRAAGMHFLISCELERLPRVRHLLSTGALDLPRARVLCHETAHLDADEAVRVVDSVLADAPELTTGQLGSRLRRRCLEADPDSARRRYKEGLADRRVEGRQNPDGTAELLGHQLPVDRVSRILAQIDILAQSLRGRDDRTIDQIRSDILLDLLEGRHANGSRARGGVDIRVDLTTLLGLDDRAGEISGWGPVIADLVRQVAERQSDGQWRIIVTDPDTGSVLHTGTTRRRPTTAQARHVRARNPVCVFPGCRAPAVTSQIDHSRDYARGGPTRVGNLGPLCPHHHQVKHRAGWKLEQDLPGTFCWTSPRGHRYRVRPPPA